MFFETCVDKNIRLTFCQWRKKIWQQEENQLQEDPLERKLPGERQLQEENLLEEDKGLAPYFFYNSLYFLISFIIAWLIKSVSSSNILVLSTMTLIDLNNSFGNLIVSYSIFSYLNSFIFPERPVVMAKLQQ